MRDAATGSRGFDFKRRPDAADWKFAVVSAGGAQRRTLLPSHTAYKFNYRRNRPESAPLSMHRIRWAASPGRSQGATAEKANAVPERCPSILFSVLTVDFAFCGAVPPQIH